MKRAWWMLGLAIVACGGGEKAPQFTEPMTLGGVTVSAEVLNRGAHVYTLRCATCHGSDGSGQGPGSRALSEPPRDFREADFKYKSTGEGELPTDEDLAVTIRRGRVDRGMPAWPALSDEDVHAVVQYLKTFSPRWQTSPEAPK